MEVDEEATPPKIEKRNAERGGCHDGVNISLDMIDY